MVAVHRGSETYMSCAYVRGLRLKLAIFCWGGGEARSVPIAWMTPSRSSGAIHVAVMCRTLRPPRGLIQRGIMGGAEQLPLFDSPVSGTVLAPHQGAKQECNRPDQLRQCRDHCYSDLGFLLPVTTSPTSRLAMVFSHCPVTSSHRNRSPAGIQVSRDGAVEAALSSHCVQSSRVKGQNLLVL